MTILMKKSMTLNDLRLHCNTRLEKIFSFYLSPAPISELASAMHYTLFNGGKRLRPLLVYASALCCGASWESADIPASTVEIMHTYSLIHDDLPCMDNADLRRGKPSCHKAYNESLAVLTGDALQMLAMQIIATHEAPLSAEQRLQMIKILSKTCGAHGMVAGQVMDTAMMKNNPLTIDSLEACYRLKTGALFSACLELGRLSSHHQQALHQHALQQFGDCIGLAFQIQDDLLDKEASTLQLGKPQALDTKNNKITYPDLCSLDQAKQKVHALYQEALTALHPLGAQAQLLRELAEWMLGRKR